MTTPKQERDHWSTRATDAEVWAVSPSDWIPSTEAVVDRIVDHLDGCARIMEIGCGTGRLTSRIAAALPNATVTGVDVSDVMLAEAKKHDLPNLEWALCDGRTLPAGEWDGVYSVVTFQHIPTSAQRSYVHQITDRLALGGRVVLQLVEGDERTDWNHHVNRTTVARWFKRNGLKASFSTDPAFPTWLWVTA